MNRRRFLEALMPGLAVSLVGCGTTTRSAAIGPPPMAAGAARIYFYRENDYYAALVWTVVSLNHQKTGALGPGTAFYRDVAPGTYLISASSDHPYPEQARTVALAAGSTTFARVSAPALWGRSELIWQGDTFVVQIIDPAVGRLQIGNLALTHG
jgi:hypothetical protein